MCAVAELEAGFISDRTKRALAAAKARGRRLGGNRGVVLTKAARKAGREAQIARAAARAADLAPVLKELREEGITSLGWNCAHVDRTRHSYSAREQRVDTYAGHADSSAVADRVGEFSNGLRIISCRSCHARLG